MGYMRHHAIVVSSCLTDMDAVRAKAVEFGNLCTSIVDGRINTYRSFMVVPDGSKEFWPDSDKGDAARDLFVAWLYEQQYSDGSSPIDWAEVIFGDEDGDCRINRCDDDSPPVVPSTAN